MFPFPIDELMDEQKGYDFLKAVLHPGGLRCPQGHSLPPEQAPPDRSREPMMTYRCRDGGRVFNIFTRTVLSNIRFNGCEIVLLLRAIVQGDPTSHIAQELGCDYGHLLKWRHRIQAQGLSNRLVVHLSDEAVEVDEGYQNSGHTGPSNDNDDQTPPRSRANKRRGRGTMATDRPPIVGLVGRESNQGRLEVCSEAQQETVIPVVKDTTEPETTVYSDEAHTYQPLADTNRQHLTVSDSEGQWATDDDGDGINEVHTNSSEGLWTQWRTFMRPFRGLHQKYLTQYALIFEWIPNLETLSFDCLRSLLIPGFTSEPI